MYYLIYKQFEIRAAYNVLIPIHVADLFKQLFFELKLFTAKCCYISRFSSTIVVKVIATFTSFSMSSKLANSYIHTIRALDVHVHGQEYIRESMQVLSYSSIHINVKSITSFDDHEYTLATVN